jgi:hypothetical protein
LELERVKVDPRTHAMTFTDPQLAADYHAVVGWLRGFFTAFNHRPDSDGNVTKGANNYQIMAWVLVIAGHIHQKPWRMLYLSS